MPPGLVLYGPPGSGKDTVTAALSIIDPRYVLFRKLKAGRDVAGAYRAMAPQDLDRLRQSGHLVYENDRYGNTYAVDEPALRAMMEGGEIPVVHMGQVAGVRALRERAAAWIAVLLWSERNVCERRLRDRRSEDLDDRLRAWDQTAADVGFADPGDFTLQVDTERCDPAAAAAIIHRAVMVTESG